MRQKIELNSPLLDDRLKANTKKRNACVKSSLDF